MKSLISAAKKIGADHIHPHQFRHTYATRLMDQGVPMEHIMALGGWNSSAMAKRYARVNPVHLQKHADRWRNYPVIRQTIWGLSPILPQSPISNE